MLKLYNRQNNTSYSEFALLVQKTLIDTERLSPSAIDDYLFDNFGFRVEFSDNYIELPFITKGPFLIGQRDQEQGLTFVKEDIPIIVVSNIPGHGGNRRQVIQYLWMLYSISSVVSVKEIYEKTQKLTQEELKSFSQRWCLMNLHAYKWIMVSANVDAKEQISKYLKKGVESHSRNDRPLGEICMAAAQLLPKAYGLNWDTCLSYGGIRFEVNGGDLSSSLIQRSPLCFGELSPEYYGECMKVITKISLDCYKDGMPKHFLFQKKLGDIDYMFIGVTFKTDEITENGIATLRTVGLVAPKNVIY